MRQVCAARLVWVMALACVLCSAYPVSAAESLPPIPKVDFENFLPVVREQVQQAYADASAHPESSTANGNLGMILHAYSVLGSAVVCYRRAHLLDPKSFRWVYYLGTVLSAQGNYDQAAATLRRALLLDPENVPAQLGLADSLLAVGDEGEAGKIYEAVLKASPENPSVHYGLGRVRAARRDWQGAMEAYVKACTLFPKYGAAHYALALAYRNLGEKEKVRSEFALYEKTKLDTPSTGDRLMAEVRALNRSGLELIRLGTDLERQGKLAEAAEAHEQALQIDPNLAQAHINLISLYSRLGDAEKAEENFRRAVELDPNAIEAYYNYGVLLFGQKNYLEAEKAFRKALEIDPFHAEAHNNLGFLLEQQGKLAEAMQEYRTAIENKPNLRLAHFHLGRIMVNERRYQEGIEHLLRTLEPEDEETPAYLYALGAAYARAGDFQPALKYYHLAREQASARGQARLLTSIDRDLKILESRRTER